MFDILLIWLSGFLLTFLLLKIAVRKDKYFNPDLTKVLLVSLLSYLYLMFAGALEVADRMNHTNWQDL